MDGVLKGEQLKQYIQYMKIGILYEEFKKIQLRGKMAFAFHVKEQEDGQLGLFTKNKKTSNALTKQAYGESLVSLSTSLFEKSCKDWFKLGLRFSKKRLNHFKEKEIKVKEIISNEDYCEGIIEELVERIKFLDLDETEKYFKRVFGITLFKKTKDKIELKKFLNLRHLVAHNCSFVDKKYLKKSNLEHSNKGGLYFINKKFLEEGIGLIQGTINKFSLGIVALLKKEALAMKKKSKKEKTVKKK